MSSKSEIISKIQAACTRVLKQANFAEGTVSALTVVIGKLSEVRDKMAAASGEMDPNLASMLYDELYECGRIVGSIYDGFPMVPAVALSDDEGAGTAKMAAADVAKACTEALEQAAGEKGTAAGAGVARALCLSALWKASGEEDAEGAELLVPTPEAMVELARACAERKLTAKNSDQTDKPAAVKPEPEPTSEDPIAKLDAIAKAADPAPAVAPEPEPVVWPADMNQRR